ncbi:MAG: hypothetical protein ACRDKY_00745 [Solirubrobacteraceae bacterium]
MAATTPPRGRTFPPRTGEDSGEVLLEMLAGSITPAAVAAGPRAVAQTVALLGAIGDRTIADLRAAAARGRDAP